MKKVLLAVIVAVGFAQQAIAGVLTSMFAGWFVKQPYSPTYEMMNDLVTMNETIEEMREKDLRVIMNTGKTTYDLLVIHQMVEQARKEEEAQKKIRFISQLFHSKDSCKNPPVFAEKKNDMLVSVFSTHNKNRE